ncbi:hypothetical protein CVD19_24065 [Bacillus sp. T33-2]|nr:hypothetical protein CVD19_24065 [Bacillus sp. T33-2]
MDNQFTKAYSIKEVSKKINVPSGTIRQWEKDLNGLLIIPRTKQGARFFTDYEIGMLVKVKEMRDKNLGKDMIQELIKRHLAEGSEAGSNYFETSLTVPAASADREQETAVVEAAGLGNFLDAMESYKLELLNDIKQEIRNGIRNEVIDEVKKEISKGSMNTVKYLSDSFKKNNEKTKTEIKDLVKTVSKQHSESFEALSSKVVNASKGASEEIVSLLNEISESTENASEEYKILADHLTSSNYKLNSLNEMAAKDREYFIETLNMEREEFQHQIKQREDIFRDMVVSFRETAAAKKTWWKFWNKR